MATLSLSAPLRTRRYVCDTCKASLRSMRNSPIATYRTFSATSPSSRRGITTQLAQCPERGAARAANNVSVSKYLPSRHYSTTSPTSQPDSSGYALLPHRRLISLSGPDTAKFMQGLITNNVDPLRQTAFYSAFLDARGRVLWDVFVWVWPKLVAEKGHWACYVEVDENEAEALKKHLKRHKLRSKVQIEDVGDTKVWAAWGSPTEQANADCITELADPRGPNMHRYLMSAGTEPIIEGAQLADVKKYHHQRYKYGIAEGPAEIARETALPMEFNIDLWHGIDFKKGCYVGQELTIRTKHTGIVRKRILPVELSNTSDALPEHGTDIKQLDDSGNVKKGRAVGKFIAGMGNVGLALCRLENMTHMKISAEGGSWKPGMEFGCETNGRVVKVSPLLHEWFVLRERELWDKNRTRI